VDGEQERGLFNIQIWLTGDLHFSHDNMVPYCGRPKDFDEQLIYNWNRLVRPEDRVIVLGDVIMGLNAEERLPGILGRLMGVKILCLGNHDKEKKWGTGKRFMELGFDFAMDYFVYDYYAFSHCPLTPLPLQSPLNPRNPVVLNIHAHMHNNPLKCPPDEKTNGEDRFYSRSYYCQNQERYKLFQLEDTLSPVLLEDFLKK
jgi:calcineurin-like phosphoesterase family protein